jgi:hypothetical protein
MKSSSAKAPTQMLWNAMVDSEESPVMPIAALKGINMICVCVNIYKCIIYTCIILSKSRRFR